MSGVLDPENGFVVLPDPVPAVGYLWLAKVPVDVPASALADWEGDGFLVGVFHPRRRSARPGLSRKKTIPNDWSNLVRHYHALDDAF